MGCIKYDFPVLLKTITDFIKLLMFANSTKSIDSDRNL